MLTSHDKNLPIHYIFAERPARTRWYIGDTLQIKIFLYLLMDRKFEKLWSKIPTKRNNNYLLDPLPLAISYVFLKKISIIDMKKLK
jgi:hypothetical protein